jgi:hypothetical protein
MFKCSQLNSKLIQNIYNQKRYIINQHWHKFKFEYKCIYSKYQTITYQSIDEEDDCLTKFAILQAHDYFRN